MATSRSRRSDAAVPPLAAVVRLCPVFLLVAGAAGCGSEPAHLLTEEHVRLALTLSPLPDPPVDETNRLVESDGAAHLGRWLFFDARLSADGSVSCATCHDPARAFADGAPVSTGLGEGTRNAPSVLNASYLRWHFWDGRADSAWSQALSAIQDPLELGSSVEDVRALTLADGELARAYELVVGARPGDHDAATVAVNLAKCIAAFEHRLLSRRAPFDVFVEGLREDDAAKLAALDEPAQRGLGVFLGVGCRSCHFGPLLTDGEFHDVGVPPPGGGPREDSGRYLGVKRLLESPFQAAGPYSDDPGGERALATRTVVDRSESWGAFKTPSLRNVAATAPYTHSGHVSTLREVLVFDSTLEGAVDIAHHGERVLQPLNLTEQEIDDLHAFLEMLTDLSVPPELTRPPRSPVPAG